MSIVVTLPNINIPNVTPTDVVTACCLFMFLVSLFPLSLGLSMGRKLNEITLMGSLGVFASLFLLNLNLGFIIVRGA